MKQYKIMLYGNRPSINKQFSDLIQSLDHKENGKEVDWMISSEFNEGWLEIKQIKVTILNMLLPNTNAHKGKDCPYFSFFLFSLYIYLVGHQVNSKR